MDDKKRKGRELADDFDLMPAYLPDSELDDEDDAGKASSKTRVWTERDRGGTPHKEPHVSAEPPHRAPPVTDWGLSRPPISVHDREELDRLDEREEPIEDSKSPAGDPEPEKPPVRDDVKKRPPAWVLATGVGGAALLLLALVYFLIPRSQTYALTVLNAPAGSTVHINDTPSGLPDAAGRITANGLKSNGSYRVRVTHPDYQEVVLTLPENEKGEDQVVEVTLRPLRAARPEPAPQPSPERPPAREPGPVSEVDFNGPMVLVAGGEFTLGDDKHRENEKPSHKVNVPAFYIDKYEVTNEQYKKFCDETKRPYPPSPTWHPRYMTANPRGPVTGVTWDDAAAYAAWAGKRLPTEAEWEKAASWDPATERKRVWPWGDDPEGGRANLRQSKNSPRLSDVGRYTGGASAYGAVDMAGNVAEWVDGFYEPYAGNTEKNAASFSSQGTRYRVVRGGTCVSSFDDARTTRRFYFSAQEKADRYPLVGFRCAVSASDPELQKRVQGRTN